MDKKKIVVIGNGMAGARVVEEILQRAPGRFVTRLAMAFQPLGVKRRAACHPLDRDRGGKACVRSELLEHLTPPR